MKRRRSDIYYFLLSCHSNLNSSLEPLLPPFSRGLRHSVRVGAAKSLDTFTHRAQNSWNLRRRANTSGAIIGLFTSVTPDPTECDSAILTPFCEPTSEWTDFETRSMKTHLQFKATKCRRWYYIICAQKLWCSVSAPSKVYGRGHKVWSNWYSDFELIEWF